MYHPYFRGKQNELMTIREMAPVLAAAKFCPIIEPVKGTLGGLQRALSAIVEAKGSAIVIVNPNYGDLHRSGEPLTELLAEEFADSSTISAGILLNEATSPEAALGHFEMHSDHAPAFIHAGFKQSKGLVGLLGQPRRHHRHIFFDHKCGRLYQKQFKGAHRILVRDGFEKKRNADYDPVEYFSELHATFEDEGMGGFGDFLIVGDTYSEGGGPAYAVAVHLTFIDPDQDDEMWVYHFVSKTRDSPKDPAGKFAEALDEMIRKLDSPSSKVLETEAVQEFRELHAKGHFPGLGYVKKLSMNHHIETLADYFGSMS